MKYVIIFYLLATFSACNKKAGNDEYPDCIQLAIDSSLSKPVQTAWIEIQEYEYNGSRVYLYIAGCCDRFNILKDPQCNVMFSPSGGITGCGDCQHRDFFNKATFTRVVWKDPRL